MLRYYSRGDDLKVLYIDVYFMINFTVDILSVFISLRVIHAKISYKRMIISAFLGALLATIELFIHNQFTVLFLSIAFLFFISLISCGMVSTARKCKFIISYFATTFLISGFVQFIYNRLDKYFEDINLYTSGTTNRKVLVFSLIILLIIGVLRLFIMTYSDSINRKSIRLMIRLEDKTVEVDALVDSGNLVKDPMSMNPVIFVKKRCAQNIFPHSVIDLTNIDCLSADFRKRIRLIPVTRNGETHIMTGVRVDKVVVYNEKRREEISATIAIDKEEGTFGGYYALAPYVAICDDK